MNKKFIAPRCFGMARESGSGLLANRPVAPKSAGLTRPQKITKKMNKKIFAPCCFGMVRESGSGLPASRPVESKSAGLTRPQRKKSYFVEGYNYTNFCFRNHNGYSYRE